MSDDFLSQDEIDALLNKNGGEEDEGGEEEKTEELDEVKKDIIGEVGNISMSTAATTLSSILNHKVLITTPRVSMVSFKEIIEECHVPKAVANVEFKEGLEGNNFLMVDVIDAAVIADLMMGGDGKDVEEKLTELETSAVGEAMNQMIGSASTSMATMLNKAIDILPPDVSVWEDEETIDPELKESGEKICKIAFDLTVEGLIESEIMQIYTMETVNTIVDIMMGDTESSGEAEEPAEQVEEPVVEPEPEAEAQPQQQAQQTQQQTQQPQETQQPQQKTVAQKPEFQELEPKEGSGVPRNLDLIMDVPLNFSVVLGQSKKTIKEVLSFNNGSVVELDKLADEPLEIYVNDKLIAEGEVVIINESFGIRVTNILSKEQRVEKLR